MARDSASIAFESAGLLGLAFSPDDEPGFGFGKVFIGQIGNGGHVPFFEPLLDGIDASFDIAEQVPGLAARLFRGQAAIVADRKPSRPALAITVLNQEGLQPAGLCPETEAPQLVVPMNLFFRDWFDRIDRLLGELHHSARVSRR